MITLAVHKSLRNDKFLDICSTDKDLFRMKYTSSKYILFESEADLFFVLIYLGQCVGPTLTILNDQRLQNRIAI